MSIRYYISNIIGGISQYFRLLNEQRAMNNIPEPRINNIQKFDKNNLILTGKIKEFPSIFSVDMIELDEIAKLSKEI